VTVPVTVLMPVFNNSAHLRAAIDSVLAQTHREFELIIVDDGSKDSSPEIIAAYRDPRVRFERFERNRGLAAALNHGLQAASAPLIARQDADDLSRPDRLARQLQLFQERPDLVIAGSLARSMTEQGAIVGTVQRPLEALSIRWYAVVDNPFIHSSVMFRRAEAMACGGYDVAFDPYAQDFELWWRLIQRGSVMNLADRLVDFRVNPGSITAKTDAPEETAYRAGFTRMLSDVISKHALDAFGLNGLAPEDARLLAGFAVGIDAATLSRFLEVFSDALSWYEQSHPEVIDSEDFRRTVARQYDAIAYRVRPASRRSAAQVYSSALRQRPQLAGVLSWPRLLAMVMFGLTGRARLARAWSGA